MGKHYQQFSSAERCEVADYRPRRILCTLNRGSSGSRAIYHLARARPQCLCYRRRSARIRTAAGRGSPLARLPPRTGRRPAGSCAVRVGRRLVASPGVGPLGPRVRTPGQLARKHLPLYLRPSWPAPRLLLAALPAAGQAQAGPARAARRGGNAIVRIPGWVPLSQRRPEANDRDTPILLRGRPDAVRQVRGPGRLLRHERHSRLLLACRRRGKAAAPIAAARARLLSPLPAERSVAWPLTTTRNLPGTAEGTRVASQLTFALPGRRGSRRELRMPSGGGGGFCRAGRTGSKCGRRS